VNNIKFPFKTPTPQNHLSRLALKIVVMARQEARGKSEEGLGDFTFLYTVWFYCVHLLKSGVADSLRGVAILRYEIPKLNL
jgi:hypothetical protein